MAKIIIHSDKVKSVHGDYKMKKSKSKIESEFYEQLFEVFRQRMIAFPDKTSDEFQKLQDDICKIEELKRITRRRYELGR